MSNTDCNVESQVEGFPQLLADNILVRMGRELDFGYDFGYCDRIDPVEGVGTTGSKC